MNISAGHNSAEDLLVGVDVGGTKVAVLVVDSAHRVCGCTTRPTDLSSHEATLVGIAEAVREAVDLAGAGMESVKAVGLGIPGRVDPQAGSVRRAVNLGWEELPVSEELTARLGVPCLLENDVCLAVLGAQRYLRSTVGKTVRDLLYLSVGTGIAAGLILDGRLYRGAHGLAGEIGHMVIETNGPICGCGGHGCLEAMAAGPAIARLAEEVAVSHGDSLLRLYEPLTAHAVYSAAQNGDTAAQGIVQRVSQYLARALQQLIMAYDVERIVLGGGVSRAGEAFLRPVLDELARLRSGSVLTNEMLGAGMISLLPPDYNAGTWGALILASGGPADDPGLT